MWRTLAIASVTVKESLRRRVFLSLAFFTVLLIAVAAGLPALDANSKIRLAQGWCLRSISFFGVLIAVFLSATSIPDDIEGKKLFLVLTKPVTRFQMLAGKLLGFAGVLGIFLGAMGLMSLLYIRHMDGSLYGGGSGILVTRTRIEPAYFEFSHGNKAAGDCTGSLSETDPPRIWLFNTSGSRFRYYFTRLYDHPLGPRIRAEITVSAQSVDASYAGDGKITISRKDTKEFNEVPLRLAWNVPSVFEIPAELVAPDGTLDVFVEPANPRSSIGATPTSLVIFTEPQPLGFEVNFLKSLITTYAELMMITTLTTMGSTLLTGPVSIFVGLFFFLTGSMIEFVRGAMRSVEALIQMQTRGAVTGHMHVDPDDVPLYLLQYSHWVTAVVLGVIPNLDRFDTPELVLQGNSVPFGHVADLCGYAGTYIAVAFLLGWLFFLLRELK